MTTPNDLPALEAELNRIISMRGETATSGRVLNVVADLAQAMKDMARIFVKEEGEVREEQTDWVLVPREPTQEMVDAWPRHNHGAGHERDIYRAMLAASPTPPPAETAEGSIDRHAYRVAHLPYPDATPPPIGDGEGDLVALIEDLRAAAMFWETGGVEKERTLEWKAAATIESLSRQLEEARDALDRCLTLAREGVKQSGVDDWAKGYRAASAGIASEIARAKETVSHG